LFNFKSKEYELLTAHTVPGLGVPGLSVLIDLRLVRSEKEGDLDLMVLMGMERLVGLRNMAGEAMV
jgi:hypothetical protein